MRFSAFQPSDTLLYCSVLTHEKVFGVFEAHNQMINSSDKWFTDAFS